MAFHPDKCSILSVTRNKNLVKFNYTLHGHPLKALVCWFSWLMMFNTTFNNILAISWRSVLLLEEIRVPGETQRPATSH